MPPAAPSFGMTTLFSGAGVRYLDVRQEFADRGRPGRTRPHPPAGAPPAAQEPSHAAGTGPWRPRPESPAACDASQGLGGHPLRPSGLRLGKPPGVEGACLNKRRWRRQAGVTITPVSKSVSVCFYSHRQPSAAEAGQLRRSASARAASSPK